MEKAFNITNEKNPFYRLALYATLFDPWNVSNNICGFFWQNVRGLIRVSLIAVVGGVLISVLLTTAVSSVIGLINGWPLPFIVFSGDELNSRWAVFYLFGEVLWVFVAAVTSIVLGLVSWNYLLEYRGLRLGTAFEQTESGRIVAGWYRAFKDNWTAAFRRCLIDKKLFAMQ